MGGGTTRMHDTLRNPFMIEVGDLLAKMEIFQERRPSLTRLERVLIVVDP